MDIQPLDHEHPAWLLQRRFTFLRSLSEAAAEPGSSGQGSDRGGGFGEVYLVRRRQLGRFFALKIVKHGIDADRTDLARQMLVREAGLLSELQHPHIIRRLHDGSDGSDVVPYLLLEYVPGPSLESFLEHHDHPLSRLRIALGISHAVAYLHSQGWQHNDLHSLNVVVDERAQWPMLIDFGLATRRDGEIDTSLLQLGRRGWIHPDVMDRKPFSNATEQFQLAKIVSYVLDPDNDDPDGESLGTQLAEILSALRRGEPDTDAATLRDAVRDLLLHRLANQEM